MTVVQTDSLIQPTPVSMSHPPDISVVIIGRNEGFRLTRCIESVQQAHWGALSHEVIYVDSRSTDQSLSKAQQLGAQALLLDDDQPCAAKARNLGIAQAQGTYILFLDGDTLLNPDFVTKAHQILEVEPRTCAVWGHRRESAPQQSLYTKVMDLDWVYPPGKTLYFGGDVLVRRCALNEVDGYDPTLKAGEEPEMCARLRAAGWEIEHIDEPMTLHDLAVRHWRPYWLRAYRSGIAYAEVAERMRLRGDILWQDAAKRDYLHGWIYLLSPLFLIIALLLPEPFNGALIALGLLGVTAIILKTARGCRWKAPNNPLLVLQYAIHVHLQKIPALFGQLAWRRNHNSQHKNTLTLVEYKDSPSATDTAPSPAPKRLKQALLTLMTPFAKLWHAVITQGWCRLWSLALLRGRTQHNIDPSNVILGPVELHGTGNIRFGRNAMIYPGCYFETQGHGAIIFGDDIVLSRGVHIVAFDRITIGTGTIIGEYSSLRDANHRLSKTSIRHSGHDAAPITIGTNVWLARGVTVLKGVTIGNNAVVAAGAVVNRDIAADAIVGGLPAKPLASSTIPELTKHDSTLLES